MTDATKPTGHDRPRPYCDGDAVCLATPTMRCGCYRCQGDDTDTFRACDAHHMKAAEAHDRVYPGRKLEWHSIPPLRPLAERVAATKAMVAKIDAELASAVSPADECAAFVARLRAVADAYETYDAVVAKDDPLAEARLIVLCLDVAGELVDDAHDSALEIVTTKEDESHLRELYNAVCDPLGELAHMTAVVWGVETHSCYGDDEPPETATPAAPAAPDAAPQPAATIAWLQREVDARWGSSAYGAAFLRREDPQRNAHHALLHVTKAAGKVAGALDDLDHTLDGTLAGAIEATLLGSPANYLADIVICVARIANDWPGVGIDLQAAITARLAAKFPPR